MGADRDLTSGAIARPTAPRPWCRIARTAWSIRWSKWVAKKNRSSRDNAQGHSATRSCVQKVIFINRLEKCAKLRGASQGDKSSVAGDSRSGAGVALVCAQAENRVDLSENPPFLTGLGWFIRSSQDRRRNQAATWFRFFYAKTGALPDARPQHTII